jgi:hypothetical protein
MTIPKVLTVAAGGLIIVTVVGLILEGPMEAVYPLRARPHADC